MSEPQPGAAPKARQQPETLRLRNLSAALTVGDLAESLIFYRDTVGFVLEETWERDGRMSGAALRAGTVRLVLAQDDWAKGRERVKGQGLRFYLYTAQDIDQLAAGIKGRGGTLASGPEDLPWGARAFSIVDPDGFQMTVSSMP